MKVRVRTRPDELPRTGIVVSSSLGASVLVIDGSSFVVHDRRLRELEVVSASDHERSVLKKQGYRIFGL
jgi:hypothetical protein